MKNVDINKINEISRLKFKLITESKDFVILKLELLPETYTLVNSEDLQLFLDKFSLIFSGVEGEVFIFKKG